MPVERAAGGTSLIDVLDRVLDKGIVIDAWVRVSLVGRKHFVMDYVISSAAGEKLVSGSTTQVMFDYALRASRRFPDDLRELIEAFDGPFGRGGRWERPGA